MEIPCRLRNVEEIMWCKANDCAENEALIAERRSMTDALKHINELDLRGGVLHVNGNKGLQMLHHH